ncbi:MAG TPA: hypothetical protein VH089_20095, partial [Streptosporangiaceae bacterium]|nr:hypothetical protein [Streptosporangiaceae bacterium]
QADHLLAETKSEAERARAQAQRQVDDLTRQKDSISSHLAQLRQLLGGGVPGMEEAASVPSVPSRPAIGADAPRPPAPAPAAPVQEARGPANGNAQQATAQAPAQRQAPQSQPARNAAPAANGAKQGANGKTADDEDWWTE